MFNQSTITECLRNLIGFEASTGFSLTDELKKSESGLTVQQLHPLLSLENLQSCAIAVGDELTKYLSSRRDTAIVKLISSVYSEKHLNENSRELITEVKMFEGVGNFNDKIVKVGRFVGFRVTLSGKDLSLIFRHLGMQFDALNPNFKLYVYHSSTLEPVATIEIAHDKAVSFVWKNFDKQVLPSIEGSSYLIGYYEDDLQGQALKREQYFTKRPNCSSCNPANYQLYQKWAKFMTIQPFYVNAEGLNEDKTKWNEADEMYIDGTNWGLNLALSVVCDPSGLFCRNREMFIDALGKQLTLDFLNDIVFSTRDNQLKEKLFQPALYAIGDNTRGAGVDLAKAIKALNFNTSELNPVCLPCQDNAFRIGYKSVF